jgi:hypothetical protein
MISTKHIIVILCMLTLFVLPTSAIIYSDEYYKLINQGNIWFYSEYAHFDNDAYNTDGSSNRANIGSFIELRRQSILLEKQNELLEEQNNLLRIAGNKTLICKSTNSYGICGKYTWE